MTALVAMKGVSTVMAAKIYPRRRLLLHSALMDAFREEYATTRYNLFPEALEAITG